MDTLIIIGAQSDIVDDALHVQGALLAERSQQRADVQEHLLHSPGCQPVRIAGLDAIQLLAGRLWRSVLAIGGEASNDLRDEL
eukprot:10916991-Alexandrium_andersonii.AAC.1